MNVKKYPWEDIETNGTISKKDVLVFHLNRYVRESNKKSKVLEQDSKLVSIYLTREKLKEMGVKSCSRMK